MARAATLAAVLTLSAGALADEPQVATTQPPAPATAPARMALGFFGLKSNGITEEETRAIGDLLQTELSTIDRYKVVAQNDLETILGHDRQKQLLGCADEANTCLSEIMGALDVDRLVVGDISRIGDLVVMNLSLLNARTSASIARGNRQVKGDAAALLDELRSLLYEVMNADEVNKAKPLEAERGFGGITLGVRVDGDVLGLGIAPGISVEYAGRRFGGALVLIAKVLPGARLEGRFYPFTFRRVRTQVAVGVTAFTEGVGARVAIGATVHFGHFNVFADFGYERFLFLKDWEASNPNAMLVGLGVGWTF